MIQVVIIIAGFFLFTSCASNVEKFSDVVAVSDMPLKPLATVSANLETNVSIYTFDNNMFEVEANFCKIGDANETTIIVNDDDSFPVDGICQSWQSQILLSYKTNTLIVNMPGIGKSSGVKDLGGPQSVEAIRSAIDNLSKIHADNLIFSGIWGWSTGSIAASFYAKAANDIKYLILGSGIYDLELTQKSTKDPKLSRTISDVLKVDDEAYEKRSIAWDTEGLSRSIFLYHGNDDAVAPFSGAASFKDTLTTAEFKVSLLVMEGVGHEITDAQHNIIMRKVLDQIFLSTNL